MIITRGGIAPVLINEVNDDSRELAERYFLGSIMEL